MSLGITPASTFGGLEATAQHLQRSLGAPPDAIFANVSAAVGTRGRHVDAATNNNPQEMSILPNSPPRRVLNAPRGGLRVPPLRVDVGESSMRDSSRVGRQDSDVANLHASHQTAQRFTDEIQRLGTGLDRYLRYLKEARQNAGADHPLWNYRLGRDDLIGGEGSGRGSNFAAPQHRGRGAGGKSPRGLSLSNSIEEGSPQLPPGGGRSGSVGQPIRLDATTKPASSSPSSSFSPSTSPRPPLPEIVDTVIVVSPPMNSSDAALDDCTSPIPPPLSRLGSNSADTATEMDAGGDLPIICEFRPLGHDIDNIMLKMNGGRLASLLPIASVSSNTIVSPPWSDSPGGGGPPLVGGLTRDITSLEEAIAAVDDIRKSASKVHRCVMDEIYEAKQSVDDLQRRMAALTKSHDQTVQRLMAATTKLQTTATALQNERTALQSVLLKFGASSPMKRGHGCFSSNGTSPTTPNAPSGGACLDDDDEFDEDELFGSPKRSSTKINGSSSPVVRLSPGDRLSSGAGTPSRSTFTFGSPGIGGAPWSSIPDEYPSDPRLVSILMLPHDMANDVLRSRRQLKLYMRLIHQLPSALQEHHDMLAKAFEEEWKPEASDASLALYDEKERLYESARLRLEGEL